MADKTLMTAEELFRLPEDGYKYELVKGELIRMPPTGGWHGVSTVQSNDVLHEFVRRHKLGYVFPAETGFLIARNPDTVRAPDAAFVSKERLPTVPEGYIPLAPDLVVEVLSPNDKPYQVQKKVREWLTAGVKLLWLVNPRTKTVTVYRPGRKPRRLGRRQRLSGEPVLPGFSCAVEELFAGIG